VNRVICVSDYDRKLAIASRVGRRDQLVTVHNGVPEVRVERSHPPQIQPVRLVMVARLGDPKQQELVIQALQGLPGGVALDLIGEGPREEVLRLVAERHGVSERVRFLGRREDVAMCLAEADIFVLMSRYEAFPLSILEAMRAGLPVVASDVGGVSEAVVEGETGFLIPRGNGSSLQDRLRTLVEQPELRRRMGSAGRARFLAGFTRERMVERTLEVYEQALAMERGRS
jgi:glycosyltransferase involved in cell wall biosynthesis